MSCLLPLLARVAEDVERQIRPQLAGFFGSMLRGYLPQTWVFETEQEVASLTVDREGRALASAGRSAPADVTIATTHDRLAAAFRERRREAVPPGPLAVTPHTEKGRMAFAYLRGRIGL